jgi:hypothetical protein
MIHLLCLTLILCGALGVTLSKTDKTTLIRKKRQHQGLLQLDREVI